jgi:hypothetical protein
MSTLSSAEERFDFVTIFGISFLKCLCVILSGVEENFWNFPVVQSVSGNIKNFYAVFS